jgi:hypothetical protein
VFRRKSNHVGLDDGVDFQLPSAPSIPCFNQVSRPVEAGDRGGALPAQIAEPYDRLSSAEPFDVALMSESTSIVQSA